MAKKTWDELSGPYRKRLMRKGITPSMHARGEGLQAARGHANDEILTRFRQLGGYHHVNRTNFGEMKKPEQAFIADLYIKGFMTPGPHGQENRDARHNFLGWSQLSGHQWDPEDWKAFKDDYRIKFSK